MKWERLGLVFAAKDKVTWARSHALQPTPLVLQDRVRVFVGMRDDDGVSRVGWVDLDLQNPGCVLGYAPTPVLDIGAAGAFDEFGVVPSTVFREDGKTYMYYAGYQRGLKVRFLAFGGLAVSDDDGLTFRRVQRTPVFERTSEDLLFRVPHCMLKEDRYRFWYGGGDHFEAGIDKSLPVYDVRHLETDSLVSIPLKGDVCVTMSGSEYRIGRPRVVRRPDGYVMFYGYSSTDCPFQLGMARSKDGLSWKRCDGELNLPLGSASWEDRMMSYPAHFEAGGHAYLLYNGNEYGADGFGLARLLSW